MSIDCQSLVNQYADWLKRNISIGTIENVCEIRTPFLDRHNDHLQIYVQKTAHGMILSDDGYILSDLELSGFSLSTQKRKQIVESILNGFGVHLKDNELTVQATTHDFPKKKHNLIQAMLSVNDQFGMAQTTVAGLFREDVESFLEEHQIRFTASIKITGRSGFDQSFEFVIPASITNPERYPERFLSTINNPNKQKLTAVLFAWSDIREVRKRQSELYVVLNDEETINQDLINACAEYGTKPLLWSEREEYAAELEG